MQFAPIFMVSDLQASLAHYARLGFDAEAWPGGGYGFARWDDVELHLGTGAPGSTASAYLFVDDAEALAAQWRAAGVDIHGPEDTPWRMREGAHVDPDGNVIRFGSPLSH